MTENAAALETTVRELEDGIADLERIINKWYDPVTTQELRIAHDTLFAAHSKFCTILGIAPVAVSKMETNSTAGTVTESESGSV